MERVEGTLKGYGGIDLYYQTWRPARDDGACVVFVHGIGDHGGRHPHLVEALTSAGHTVTAPDMRGHGRSPGLRGHINSWTEYREDLRLVIGLASAARPDAPLFVVGHSLGGLIVLEYALHYPDGLRGVVAMSPALSTGGVPQWKLIASRVLDRVAPRLSMKVGLESGGISRDPSIKAADDEDPLCHPMASVRFGVETQKALAFTLGHAEELRAPLLIVHGTGDTVVPAGSSLSFFEKVRFRDKTRIEYPGAYHELDNDWAKDEALRDIVAWIAARLDPRA